MPDSEGYVRSDVLTRGRESASGIEEASRAAKERLLDELFNRPSRLQDDRLQVLRNSELPSRSEGPRSTELLADGLKERAMRLLLEAHKQLVFTGDRFEPRSLAYRPRVRIGADSSAADIARVELGEAATAKQIESYAAMILRLNGIAGDMNDPVIKEGRYVSLPGQRTDGGLFYRRNGKTVTEWHNGSRFEVSERGAGFAAFKDGDGADVRIEWNPDDKSACVETRIKGNHKTETVAFGDRLEYVRSEAQPDWRLSRQTTTDHINRQVELIFDPASRNAPPERILITDKEKNVIDLRSAGPGLYSGEKRNAGGEVLDAHVRMKVERNGLSIYSEKTADNGEITRTFESGLVLSLNEKEELLRREGQDSWGRKVVEQYKAGEGLPQTIFVEMKDGKTIEFARKPFGDYVADYLSPKGEKIGTIELKPNGLVLFSNDRSRKAHAELPDGTLIERTSFPNGRQEIRQSKDGNVLKKLLDREGTVIDAEYSSSDGRKIRRKTSADGESIESITLEDKERFKTELRYDRDIGLFTGYRCNEAGERVERAFFMQGKLVYSDLKSGETRFERLNVFERDLFGVKLSAGKYEAATGTINYRNADGSTTIESFAPGRSDVVKEGTVKGTTITGERSRVEPTGQAVVHHPDDTGVRLNANETVDRWGPAADDNSLGEPLTKVEGVYLRAHPDLDRRAFAEIHRKFHGRAEQLDRFYMALAEIDRLAGATEAEKSGLRRGLMHHVAYPAEIYQGNSWCCNVAVLQRELAVNMPDRYVRTVVEGLSKGEVALGDGSKVSVKDSNLKLADTTGRDLPTRVFQTIALQIGFQPRYTFKNTEDGVGRLIPEDGKSKPAAFAGMDMDEIVRTRHKLTGEQKAVVHVTSVDELVKAFEMNGSRTMVVAVNADQPPFSDNGLAALFAGQSVSRPNHVVTVTRIEPGPPVKCYVQNQWGLKEDLSSPTTAVEASVLLASMIGRVRARGGGRIVETPAQVIAPGDPARSYFFKDGKLVEEKRH